MLSTSAKVRLFLAMAVLFSFQTAVVAQQVIRLVDKVSWQLEPVTITKLTTNGSDVEVGKRFRADKDWLNELTIFVQNTSNKSVARIEISLAFPRFATTSVESPTY